GSQKGDSMLFPTVQIKDFRLTAALCVAATLGFVCTAQAETTRIVAIGASNTSGYKVGASNAWPALLEQMLKAKGLDVTVVNAGVTAETSSQTVARVGSV